ncbi:hypothetical protein LZD57_15480 [Jiella sp. CBK1P-4]|uniref:Uncharacterized protein n=2 Tax=Jiella avicenniae TaxID=2907202 RepID=A0A9X1P2N3_9HYPH|nr:hypothetical protein [Jiella avicenniae]
MPILKTLFYRPTEHVLLQALDESHPITRIMFPGMVYERRPSERSEVGQAATAGSLMVPRIGMAAEETILLRHRASYFDVFS